MAVVAEAYDAQTTITKAMLALLKNRVWLRGFEFVIASKELRVVS
jgi:hypothetical protein